MHADAYAVCLRCSPSQLITVLPCRTTKGNIDRGSHIYQRPRSCRLAQGQHIYHKVVGLCEYQARPSLPCPYLTANHSPTASEMEAATQPEVFTFSSWRSLPYYLPYKYDPSITYHHSASATLDSRSEDPFVTSPLSPPPPYLPFLSSSDHPDHPY